MIKALSPYYVSIPWIAPLSGNLATQFTLNIYVWNGLKTAVPSTPTYSVVKDNATSTNETIEINISNWIADFIEFKPQEGVTTELINGNNQFWVKWETLYKTITPTDGLIPSNINVELFNRGYSYGLDGKNADIPVNKILIPIQEYKVSRDSKFLIPILINQTNEVTGVIEITSHSYNTQTITESNIDISFSITGFSPSNVVVEESINEIDFTELYVLTNTSPLTGVIINYAESGNKFIRLSFTDSGNYYVSNNIDIGLV